MLILISLFIASFESSYFRSLQLCVRRIIIEENDSERRRVMEKVQLQLPMSQEEAVGLLATVSTPLLEWYDKHARVLPWRSNPEPYWVWLSEIMLQQTRVEAVLP